MPTPHYVTDALRYLAASQPAYDQAAAFYNGDVAEVFASQRLRQLLGHTHHHFHVNYARTPVDVLLERTVINGVTVSDSGTLALLQQVWDDNELGLEAKDLHRRVYEYGDAYMIAWPSGELAGGVEVYTHDPRSVRVFYDPGRPRVKTHAVHQWIEEASAENGLVEGFYQRVNLYYPDRVEQFVSRHRIDLRGSLLPVTSDPDLVPYADEGAPDGVTENPVPGTLPIFHFRNARPYGRPEHADAYGPQQMINKLSTTMMASVDFAGFPQRYVTTDAALNPTPLGDAFSEEPPDISSTESGLSGDSSLEAGPGSTWLLSGSKLAVGQFAVAQTSNFLDAIHSLIKQMSSVTDLPLHFFERSGQVPSGEALRAAESPLRRKVDDRLAILGVTWHELFEYCLLANGRLGGTDARVAWDPAETQTDLDSWNSARLQIEAGVPRDVVFMERGYAPSVVQTWPSVASPIPSPQPIRAAKRRVRYTVPSVQAT